MSKHFFLVLLISVMLTLTGCGGSGDSSSSSSSTNDDKSINSVSYGINLLDNSHGIKSNAWQLESCDGCHLMADIHQQQSNIQQIVKQKGYQYQQKVQCIDCHAMHGTPNDKLIIGSSLVGARQLLNQVFTDLISQGVINKAEISVTTTAGDNSQLCVVCHQMTDILEQGNVDTGNGLSGVHLTGESCQNCHQHGMATQTGL